MTITVKKLIEELEKIENKLLEVECHVTDSRAVTHQIESVKKVNKKVLIFTRDYADD